MIENFDRLHGLPEGFFDITTANIRNLFPNPTLIQLDGRGSDFLFISILLHGNEYTGLKVMQKVLADHAADLPRSILLFIGNVRAAEASRRYLPDQVDYNRCWPGTNLEPSATSQMMQPIPVRILITPVLPTPTPKTRTSRRDSIASAWCSSITGSVPWRSTGSVRQRLSSADCPATCRESNTPVASSTTC